MPQHGYDHFWRIVPFSEGIADVFRIVINLSKDGESEGFRTPEFFAAALV